MFGKSGTIYTVHENTQAQEPSDRIVVVREGFSVWAFLLTVIWLLAYKCWRMSAVYAVLFLLAEYGGPRLGLQDLSVSLIELGLQLWLGFVANDARRAALERSGYREIDVVCAESDLLAERRYFDRQLWLKQAH